MASGLPSRQAEALTGRERRVLRYLVQGFSLAEVAGSLGLSVSTVERLYLEMCRKLHLNDRPLVRRYAAAIGLLDENGRGASKPATSRRLAISLKSAIRALQTSIHKLEKTDGSSLLIDARKKRLVRMRQELEQLNEPGPKKGH